MKINIKYNKFFPIFGMTLAVTFGVLFYLGSQRGVKVEPAMKFVVPMVFLMSIPRLFINYIEVSEREIVVRNQFGMVSNRYAINNWNEISMVENRIFLDKPSKKEEVKFKRFLASKKGLQELNAKLNHLI